MKIKLLDILVCPFCQLPLALSSGEVVGGSIAEGSLNCSKCERNFPISNGIPRFIEANNYASSFGYQWNLFRKEQIDSYNGTKLSSKRFWSETAWTVDELKDKWVLDVGCGAGRFLDVSSMSEADVVGVDISNAVDAAQANLEGRENVHFVQASIYELPFRNGSFDYCYCIGVIQHTPDTDKSLHAIVQMVKNDGEVAVTIYERRKWFTKLFSKYWFRPITKRLRKETLLKLIEGVMPIAFPLTDILFRLPAIGKIFIFAIPVANYVHEKELSRDQRYAWAILDTFDMLSPQFDSPMTESEATKALSEAGVSKFNRLPNPGVNITGKRDFKAST